MSDMTRDKAIEILKGLVFGTLYKTSAEERKALELAVEALEQNQKLANRCFALTYGTLCMYCPIECDRRTKAYRGEVDHE